MWHDAIDITKELLKEVKEKQKFYYDKNTKEVNYKIGDTILLKEMHNAPGKFNMRWEGPYLVKEKKSDVNYRIESLDKKKTILTHVDRMKLFNRDDDGKNIVEVELEVEQEVKNNGNTVEVKQKEAEKGNNLKIVIK